MNIIKLLGVIGLSLFSTSSYASHDRATILKLNSDIVKLKAQLRGEFKSSRDALYFTATLHERDPKADFYVDNCYMDSFNSKWIAWGDCPNISYVNDRVNGLSFQAGDKDGAGFVKARIMLDANEFRCDKKGFDTSKDAAPVMLQRIMKKVGCFDVEDGKHNPAHKSLTGGFTFKSPPKEALNNIYRYLIRDKEGLDSSESVDSFDFKNSLETKTLLSVISIQGSNVYFIELKMSY